VDNGAAESLGPRLAAWLARAGRSGWALEPLAGDLSARTYFRVRSPAGATRVVACYPAQLRDAQLRFARAAALLARASVRVPGIEIDDPAAGFALLEDLGERTLFDCAELDPAARADYLAAALESARRIAALSREEVEALGSSPLDRSLLVRELDDTVRHFLAPRGLAPPGFVAALEELCRLLAADPLVPCHRDFMVRNLMPIGAAGVAVLDFQDLRLGPPAYDLASLLNDSWFASGELERDLLGRYLAAGVAPDQYRRAVVQRALKAVGTFTACAARGDGRRLALVGPTLARALPHLAELPETRTWSRELAVGLAEAAATPETIC
jgi:aminoglycoside/choline kinase family phosphotransferase